MLAGGHHKGIMRRIMVEGTILTKNAIIVTKRVICQRIVGQKEVDAGARDPKGGKEDQHPKQDMQIKHVRHK
jgi:hypothetical protein